MDGFQLKIIEQMLYSTTKLTTSKLEEITGMLYTTHKQYGKIYKYSLAGTSGRSARLNKILCIKLKEAGMDASYSKILYTYITLTKTHNGVITSSWNSFSKLTKPSTWDKEKGV